MSQVEREGDFDADRPVALNPAPALSKASRPHRRSIRPMILSRSGGKDGHRAARSIEYQNNQKIIIFNNKKDIFI